jgi:hypothetical protein
LKCSKSIRMVCLQTIPRQWAPLLRLVRSIQTQSSQSKPLYCTDYLRSPRYVNSFLSRRHFSLLVLSLSATNLNRLYPQATTVSRQNARNARIPFKFEFSDTYSRKIDKNASTIHMPFVGAFLKIASLLLVPCVLICRSLPSTALGYTSSDETRAGL